MPVARPGGIRLWWAVPASPRRRLRSRSGSGSGRWPCLRGWRRGRHRLGRWDGVLLRVGISVCVRRGMRPPVPRLSAAQSSVGVHAVAVAQGKISEVRPVHGDRPADGRGGPEHPAVRLVPPAQGSGLLLDPPVDAAGRLRAVHRLHRGRHGAYALGGCPKPRQQDDEVQRMRPGQSRGGVYQHAMEPDRESTDVQDLRGGTDEEAEAVQERRECW